MSEAHRVKAVGLLLLLALIWGTSFILIKQGLKVYAPDELGALRVTAAFLFLLPVAIVRLKTLQSRDYKLLFVSGMLGIFIPAFLFATAQTRISSSVAGILNTLSPLFTMMMGALFFGQRFGGVSIIGTIIGMVGTVILLMARAAGDIGGLNFYALLIVLACVLYGTNVNWVKFKIHHVAPLTLTSVALLMIGPLAIIYLFGFTEATTKLAEVDGAWTALGFIVVLGLMSTAIATYLFAVLLKISSPLFASSVTYLMPLVSVAWGLLDNEQLAAGHLVGMVLIIGGVWLANYRPAASTVTITGK